MQKHPRISAGSQSGNCPFTSVAISQFIPVSRFGFQRYVRKASFAWRPSTSVKVFNLPCGCCLWVHASGQRFLSALPF
jgi:hypothetical protein